MAKGYWGEQLQNALGGFLGTPGAPSGMYLRDFQHASKTFVSDSYALAPKYKFTFHTYFELNSPLPTGQFANFGLLVKEVKLPSYRFSTTTLNQYNRKRIIQSKINYDPVEIAFHDDNSNVINKLWYAYYTYYYKDASKLAITPTNNTTQSTMADFSERNIYNDDASGNSDWGYIGEPSSVEFNQGQNVKAPFFKSIRVFGFNQHKFTEYKLINPIISNFSHDTYAYDQSAGVMQNRMTFEYETVVYNEGTYNGADTPIPQIPHFAEAANYDKTLSPISLPGSNGKILGPAGILDGVGGFVGELGKGNILGAAKIAGATYNNLKTYDLKSAGKIEAENLILGALGSLTIGKTIANSTRNQKAQFPGAETTPTTNGAGTPTITSPVTDIPAGAFDPDSPDYNPDIFYQVMGINSPTPTAGQQVPTSNSNSPNTRSLGPFNGASF